MENITEEELMNLVLQDEKILDKIINEFEDENFNKILTENNSRMIRN